MKKYLWLLCGVLTLVSCNNSQVKVKGKFPCCAGKKAYLDMVTPGKQQLVDSALLDDKGGFKFKVALPDGMPTIFNIRMESEFIPMLLAKGDKVNINAVGSISRNYTIKGSEGSTLMQTINGILTNGAAKLDSLSKAYIAMSDESVKKEMLKEYSQLYYGIKRDHVKFIVENASSIVAIYALYQRLPNDETLFNGDGDVVYFRMVADSVSTTAPKSPYLLSLQKMVADFDNRQSIMTLIGENMQSESRGYPDVTLPDMYGNKIKLSSLKGKTVLVDFWSAAVPACKLTNAELKETYAANSSKGFEIYQIAVDESKPLWVTTVQEQKLPWLTLCDFKGGMSPAVTSYNVSSIPANYLISASGEIVGKNLYGSKLEEKLKQLLP